MNIGRPSPTAAGSANSSTGKHPVGDAEARSGRCGAKLRGERAGSYCPNWPIHGGTRCRMHSGAPGRAAARQRVAAAKALHLVPAELAPITNPIQALLDLTAEALAFKDAIASHVNDITDRIRSTDDKGGEQLRSEVVVYERALDRAGRLLVDINRLGLEERLVKIRESEAQRMFAALQAALQAAGLDDEQQREARRVAGRHLRLAGQAG